MQTVASPLANLLARAYILGGSPCSGKSTIAERLAAHYKYAYYKVDDHDRVHAERCQPDRHPVMYTYSTMTWNEIWMRSVSLQVREEFEYYRERFEMIGRDLEAYAGSDVLLLEGAAYFPDLIWPYIGFSNRVIYLVPTQEFQVQHYRQRPWIQSILKECTDPEQAFDNWMARDALFGQEVLRQAQAHHYQTLVIDGQLSLDEEYDRVREYWGLA